MISCARCGTVYTTRESAERAGLQFRGKGAYHPKPGQCAEARAWDAHAEQRRWSKVGKR